jgi:hypothetical protein
MIDLTPFGTASYGTSAFQVVDFDVQEQPVIKEGVGRIGTDVVATIDGFFEGTDANDLAAKSVAVRADLAVGGRDLVVKGLGGATVLRPAGRGRPGRRAARRHRRLQRPMARTGSS